MDTRLSVSNRLLSITFGQFVAIVTEFKTLTEASFGTECNLQIIAMNAPKVFSTFGLDDHVLASMKRENEKRTFFKTDEMAKITTEIFKAAFYVEVYLRPANEAVAPKYAFSHLEFKGYCPRSATYYIQPGDSTVLQTLKKRHRYMALGAVSERTAGVDKSLRRILDNSNSIPTMSVDHNFQEG